KKKKKGEDRILSTNSSNSNSGNEDLRLRECFSDDNGRTSSRYRDNCLKLNKLSHLEELEEEGGGVRAGEKSEDIMLKTQKNTTERIKNMCPPSSGALPANFPGIQKEALIYCHRPPKYFDLPTTFFHPTFNKFLNHYNDKTLNIPKKICEGVFYFVEEMAEIFSHEKPRKKILHDFLRDCLDLNPLELILDDDSSNDGVVLLVEKYLGIVIEVKAEIGSGKCDPYLQGSLEYSKFWAQDQFKDFKENCNCPSFIICLAGPWICIASAIFLDRIIIDPLTDFIPLQPAFDNYGLDRISRLFFALKSAIIDLKEFYRKIEAQKVFHGHQNFFPYVNTFVQDGREVKFIYTEHISRGVYKAKISKNGLVVIVKFSRRYNADAHKLCAAMGFAPKLLHVDTEKMQEWIIIIMEYAHNAKQLQDSHLDLEQKKLILKEIRAAIDLLHENNIVFGDFRSNNILIYEKVQQVHALLIDFDWSGVSDKDRYPFFMNYDITWPTGAGDGEILRKNHDEEWYKRLEKLLEK
ncbi:7075_t:CDS:2, partial [Entrophospora sp. SA101]